MNKYKKQRIFFWTAYFISFMMLPIFYDAGAVIITAVILTSFHLAGRTYEKEYEELERMSHQRIKKVFRTWGIYNEIKRKNK